MTKADLRIEFKNKRQALTAAQQEKLDDLLLIQFQKLELPFLQNIVSFFPIEKNKEPDTFLITRFLQFQNPQINIAYPRLIYGNEMEAVIATVDSEFVEKKFGIQELQDGAIMQPQDIELLLIPMLCCDYSGNRVGYGKGYYDRYLEHTSTKALKIGLCHFDVVDEVKDIGYGDIPLDICITPDITYEFR